MTATTQYMNVAQRNLANLEGSQPVDLTAAGAAFATAHATLALAEAQLTANRIAWAQWLFGHGQGAHPDTVRLVKQIERDLA